MSAELTLYAINIISNIGYTIATIFLLFSVISIVLIMVYDDNLEELKKYFKLILPLLAILLFINIILPSPKTMYMMASTHYLKNNGIPSKVLEVLNYKLDEIITENKKG